MLVMILATLCLGDVCVEKVVTDQATLAQCGATAAQRIPQWMEEQGYTARGYRLAKWGCAIGGKRKIES